MIDWRYCGRFSDWTQNAIPEPNLTWIDETEAKRRYALPMQELALIPVLQDPSGILPWHINVTTGENPSFMITFQRPRGCRSHASGGATWAMVDCSRTRRISGITPTSHPTRCFK